jgi:hypothetical protein
MLARTGCLLAMSSSGLRRIWVGSATRWTAARSAAKFEHSAAIAMISCRLSALGLVVGDASGKGVAAALMIVSVQSSLLTAVLFAGNDPAALLKIVNLQVHASSLADSYATVFNGFFDRSTRVPRYVNAGHTPPVVLRRNDSINKLETRGVHLLECFLIHATRREPCSLIPAIWSSPAPTESLALSIRATECEAGLASLGCKTC